MKTLAITSSILLFAFAIKAQDSDKIIPKEVKQKFSVEFLNASSINWKPAEENGNYDADFIDGGTHKRVLYTNRGELLFSEISLHPGQLPQVVSDLIQKDYSGYVVERIHRIETNKEVSIRLRLGKGHDRFEIEIDLRGKIKVKRKIKKVYKDDDGDDDEREHKHKHKERKHKHDHNEEDECED
jgi:hypothetical protein